MIASETTEDTEGKNTRCSLGTLWQKIYFMYNKKEKVY